VLTGGDLGWVVKGVVGGAYNNTIVVRCCIHVTYIERCAVTAAGANHSGRHSNLFDVLM